MIEKDAVVRATVVTVFPALFATSRRSSNCSGSTSAANNFCQCEHGELYTRSWLLVASSEQRGKCSQEPSIGAPTVKLIKLKVRDVSDKIIECDLVCLLYKLFKTQECSDLFTAMGAIFALKKLFNHGLISRPSQSYSDSASVHRCYLGAREDY